MDIEPRDVVARVRDAVADAVKSDLLCVYSAGS